MKRRLISTAIILSLLGGLTACSRDDVSESNNSWENLSGISENFSDKSKISDIGNGDSELESSVPEIPEWKDFIGADGQPVTLSDASVGEEGRVTFDYCFIKYAATIYDDTFKNPDLINWETLEFASHNYCYTPTIKRLRAGDVLENGLKVTKAEHTLEYGTYIDEATWEIRSGWTDYYGEICFDGELTLSGALYCVPEDDYQTFEGELYFFADTTSFPQLPIWHDFVPEESAEYKVWDQVFPNAKLAVVGGSMYYLGNISETNCDGLIEKGKAAEVTVTIDNIRINSTNSNYGGRGGGCFANIVSVEKINV